jgi:Skp family chaperone for outer membrane proteins
VALADAPVVAVVGTYRSGTSVVTSIVHELGLPVCAAGDLMAANEFNPDGYWESVSVSAFADRVLRERLNADWTSPPPPDPWDEPLLAEVADEGRRALLATHPPPPFVWKDTRSCVLLPLWRRALADRMAVVLVHRHPLATARSLQRRDGLPIVHGLALWERCYRSALGALTGLPVLVMSHAELVADPTTQVRAMRAFLSEQGLPLRRGPVAAVAGVVRRIDDREDDDAELDPSQVDLRKVLANLAGSHVSFPLVSLEPEPRWVEGLLEARRRSCRPSAAAEPAGPVGADEAAALRSELERAGGYARDLESELRRRVAELDVAQGEVRALISDLAMKECHLVELEAALDAAEREVERERGSLRHGEQELARLQATGVALADAQAQVRAYRSRVAVRLADRSHPALARLPGVLAVAGLVARFAAPSPP